MHRGRVVATTANSPRTAFHDVPVKKCTSSISFKVGITPKRWAFLSTLDIGGDESLKVKGFPQGHTGVLFGWGGRWWGRPNPLYLTPRVQALSLSPCPYSISKVRCLSFMLILVICGVLFAFQMLSFTPLHWNSRSSL